MNNNMIKKSFFLLMCIGLVFIQGCKKVEGPGGESTVKGIVMLKVYDVDYKVLQRIVPAADENVYISYGNNNYADDKTSTGPDGSFKFEYLQAGTYKITVYGEDSSGEMDKKSSVEKVISVGDSKTATVDTMYKLKTVNFDQGYASVYGRVRAVNWTKNYIDIIDTTPAQEREVYLIYGDHKTFDQRYRTNYDGRFEFDFLIKGNYTMFVYSEDIYGAPEMHTMLYKFTVDDQNQILDQNNNKIDSIPDIFVNIEQ